MKAYLAVHDIGARDPQPAVELRPAATSDGCGPFIYASAGHGQDGRYSSRLRPAAASCGSVCSGVPSSR